ncbi:hypothetical protein BaRGS_00006860 [Batillaria attramentaria]|uniref:Uncharacterized protein n=1 Tax=Batillaria attramentaria TaxID=370345 RepID=A0ABD0LRX8_9CAEN
MRAGGFVVATPDPLTVNRSKSASWEDSPSLSLPDKTARVHTLVRMPQRMRADEWQPQKGDNHLWNLIVARRQHPASARLVSGVVRPV